MNKQELEKRTIEFSVALISALKKLPHSIPNVRCIGQAIDAGTSIGANYREANGAESRKDFQHKIGISFKEARETNYWLNILSATNPENREILIPLVNESYELSRIFGSSFSTLRLNQKNLKILNRKINQKSQI